MPAGVDLVPRPVEPPKFPVLSANRIFWTRVRNDAFITLAGCIPTPGLQGTFACSEAVPRKPRRDLHCSVLHVSPEFPSWMVLVAQPTGLRHLLHLKRTGALSPFNVSKRFYSERRKFNKSWCR
jgi:hypothetical protein